jgi:radical SAM protein with 4Fe4S-binding SPASM domain
MPMKLLRHSDKIREMLAGTTVFPISIELDLSNKCNHNCSWCNYNGFRQENWKSFDDARILSLLSELAEVGVKSITFTGGGEPLVHHRAADIFRHCAALGMQFGVVTNGRRMEGEAAEVIAKHATFVRVSLDAGTTQTHQLLHATPMPEYTLILKNIAQVVALAKDRTPPLTVGASFCVFDVNLGEISRAAERLKAIGASYLEVRPVFATEWRGGGFSNPLTGEHIAQAQTNLQAAKDTYDGDGFRVIGMVQRFDQVSETTKPFSKCRIGPLTTVINADGFIYHCCQTRGLPAFRAGSVLDTPFKEVWWNAQHRAMVDAIDVEKCPPCRYSGYLEIIEQAFLADGMHANFI